ncbi:MAG: hypothetical protein RL536_558, partial [Candidatus Parcubacteria bacterium]
MKRALFFLIVVLLGSFIANRYSKTAHKVLGPYITKIENIFVPPVPCTQPILYSIDSFDSRFGISKSQFLKDIAQAANVWSTAHGSTLFSYDDDASLRVNLLFDYRQQATVRLNQIDSVIKDNRTKYDALKSRYDALSAQYLEAKSALQVKLDSYNHNVAAYNEKVSSWNARGGAPKQEYQKLQSKKDSLAVEASTLNQDRSAFNQLTDTLNSMVPELNNLVKVLNLNVKTYNTVGASTGEEFNEGEYIVDSSGTYINIYQFKDEGQLIRVLEHEFGHALGLNHVQDPKAIMYYLNEGTNEKLTAND